MDVKRAIKQIETAVEKMETAMGEPVFDEWILIGRQGGEWKLLHYAGPRPDTFLNDFREDMAALRRTLDLSSVQTGDFAFSHEGQGTGFDAYMCIGPDVLVLFNNTAKDTGAITADPRWTAAQVHFSNLLESFLADSCLL